MIGKMYFTSAALAFALATSLVLAQQATTPQAQQPAMQLPPGWTQADMDAMVAAATPGKPQEILASKAGTWQGKSTMWMGPDSPPIPAECTMTITKLMEGRYVQAQISGDVPGMGPTTSITTYGYDNAEGKFVCTAIDSMSTGIATGAGALSPDGKTLTWTHTFFCPLNKKMTALREVQTFTSDNSMTLEMTGPDAKTGKEFKMMTVTFTRKP